MDWLGCGIFMTCVTLCMVSGDKIKHNLSNNAMKISFNELLNAVTNVNQHRLNTIGKLYELDNYEPQSVKSYHEPNVSDEQTEENELNDNKIKNKFNKLLYVVTVLNKNRLDGSKQLYELNSYGPKSFARTTDVDNVLDILSDEDDDDEPIITGKTKSKNVHYTSTLYKSEPKAEPSDTLKSIIKKSLDKNNLGDVIATKTSTNQERYGVKDILRAWKGCNRSAAKACKKACKSSFKEVCSDYKCSRSMKKAFRRSCKRSCNSKFDQQ